MIRSIELELFKCFEVLKLPVAPLTLLSGANASGKSTILQAMVLLHQTILDHEWSTRLQLNGSELQLGTVTDVVDKVHGRREFRIALEDDVCSVRWVFSYEEDKQSMSAFVASVEVNGRVVKRPKKLRFLFPEPLEEADNLALRLRTLSYLTAERVGPRDSYPLQDPSATQVVGPRGENAVGMLYQRRDDPVLPLLTLNDAAPRLEKQVEAQMARFFPGTSLTVQPVPQANMVTLGLTNTGETGFHRPVNVGFGLTQVLPIIVAALASSSGDLLLIENPEVHLHPAGQALMGEFLAEVSHAGVQVLVESHSDHVLNGIRRAVKKQALPADQVSLHFFKPRGSNVEQVTSPVIGPDGNIDHWPEGFFDQFDKDLNYFAGWGE
jgi:predicted ATPase